MRKLIVSLFLSVVAIAALAIDGVPVPGVQYIVNPTTGVIQGYRNPVTGNDEQQIATIDFGTSIKMGRLLASTTTPAIASGFGSTSSPSISAASTAAFRITVGTASASTGILTLPQASNGWACNATDVTNNATIVVGQSATSTTSATLTSYSRTAGTASGWASGDVVQVSCFGY